MKKITDITPLLFPIGFIMLLHDVSPISEILKSIHFVLSLVLIVVGGIASIHLLENK